MRRTLVTRPRVFLGETDLTPAGSPNTAFGVGIIAMTLTAPAQRTGIITQANIVGFTGHAGNVNLLTGSVAGTGLTVRSVDSTVRALAVGNNVIGNLALPIAAGDFLGIYCPSTGSAWIGINAPGAGSYGGQASAALPTVGATFTMAVFTGGGGLCANVLIL